MQYVDSVASTISQHAPLTSAASKPAILSQAINYKPQAPVFPLHHAMPVQAPAPAIAPTYMHQTNTHAKNPSLMASFYGSAQAHHPAHTAAYVGGTSPLQQASSDSLQSTFGNLASLDIYRSKLKMIAAYKNYQRRLKEYRLKLTAVNKAKVTPNPQGFAGAVTQPPRPGANAFAQPQTYRGYYRPEAMAAQNVQLNRAYPQGAYGTYATNYPNQYASPYGYQAQASPYYRSKTASSRRRQNSKHRQAIHNQAVHYYKKPQQHQPQPQQQFHEKPQQQQPQQQFHQEPQQQQLQQQFHQEPPTKQQEQAFIKTQVIITIFSWIYLNQLYELFCLIH